MPRSRILYFLLVGGIVVTGLILHSRIVPMQPTLRKYVGDALWAAMVFFALGGMLNRASIGRVALFAFGLASLIEISQLYHAPWIDSIRVTIPGRLVLGSTFNWPDFIAYAAGIGTGCIAEVTIQARWRRGTP